METNLIQCSISCLHIFKFPSLKIKIKNKYIRRNIRIARPSLGRSCRYTRLYIFTFILLNDRRKICVYTAHRNETATKPKTKKLIPHIIYVWGVFLLILNFHMK